MVQRNLCAYILPYTTIFIWRLFGDIFYCMYTLYWSSDFRPIFMMCFVVAVVFFFFLLTFNGIAVKWWFPKKQSMMLTTSLWHITLDTLQISEKINENLVPITCAISFKIYWEKNESSLCRLCESNAKITFVINGPFSVIFISIFTFALMAFQQLCILWILKIPIQFAMWNKYIYRRTHTESTNIGHTTRCVEYR